MYVKMEANMDNLKKEVKVDSREETEKKMRMKMKKKI